MAWSGNSRCVFCDGKIPMIGGAGKFCTKAHEQQYQKEQDRLAVEVLHRTHDALQAYKGGRSAADILGTGAGANAPLPPPSPYSAPAPFASAPPLSALPPVRSTVAPTRPSSAPQLPTHFGESFQAGHGSLWTTLREWCLGWLRSSRAART